MPYGSQAHLLEALRVAGYEIPEKDDVRVFVKIPGGGDWSNSDLELDPHRNGDGDLLHIEWPEDHAADFVHPYT